jgi:UDP-arabinose 4-epimerase
MVGARRRQRKKEGRRAVLVTGGAGYVGSHACKALWRAGFLPIAYDNLSRGHEEAVRWGPFVKGETGDESLLVRIIREHGIDAVMHFAGFAYVAESMAHPEMYLRNNFTDPLALLDAMVETGVKDLIFSSTCATYGVPQTVPIAEDHPQAPINPYGESKLMFERAVRWYGEIRGLRWVSLRYFNAAGADLDGELVEHHEPETHLIPVAIRAALGGDPLMIMGSDYPTFDGTAVRDFVHVADLADAHVKALQYIDRGGPSAAFNLGTGNGHSVLEVVAAVERVSGRAVPYKLGARRQGDPAVLVADASRVRAATGWQPTHSRLDLMVETALVGQEQLLRVETETISLPAASPLPQVMPAAIEAPVAVQAAAGLAQIE